MNTDMGKALNKIITERKNWVSLLKLTQPESWSTNAIYKLTTMFASSSKAGLFFKNFLLPRVKEDIRTHKKLHFFLYQSLRKTLFNPKAFYLGIVLCVRCVCFCQSHQHFLLLLLKIPFLNNLACFSVWNMYRP